MSNKNQFLDSVIIHNPERQSKAGRHVYRVLTLLAWTAYLYLWLPIATLALWWLGAWLGVQELQRTRVFIDYELFVLMLKALGIALVLVLSWAEYNRIRFRGEDRRSHAQPISTVSTAEAMGVEPSLAGRLQDMRRATVVTDPQSVPIALR